MITRRNVLKTIALSSGAIALSSAALPAQTAPPASESPEGVFKLPPLGYDYDALEPFIDAETMKLHHDKHHAAYVSKLNLALARAPGLEKKPIQEILGHLEVVPEEVRTDIRNHGGGHANHSLLWETLKKGENAKPSGELSQAIERTFGGLNKFQEQISETALKVFGSGWAWLVWRDNKLTIESTPNQDSPLLTGGMPLLGIDVWEHAYYLRYQNRRAEYLKAIQNIIHWELVSERFSQLSS